MYKNPAHDPTNHMNENQLQTDFDLFYEDVFMELAKFGEVEEMVVCDNVGDHLVGNVYCQFRLEESAGNAVTSLNNRFYAGKKMANDYLFEFMRVLYVVFYRSSYICRVITSN